jgi:hypothetical protein
MNKAKFDSKKAGITTFQPPLGAQERSQGFSAFHYPETMNLTFLFLSRFREGNAVIREVQIAR